MTESTVGVGKVLVLPVSFEAPGGPLKSGKVAQPLSSAPEANNTPISAFDKLAPKCLGMMGNQLLVVVKLGEFFGETYTQASTFKSRVAKAQADQAEVGIAQFVIMYNIINGLLIADNIHYHKLPFEIT